MDRLTDLLLRKLKTPRGKKFTLAVFVLVILPATFFYYLRSELLNRYDALESIVITDRNDLVIAIKPNKKGQYAYYVDSLPHQFKKLLVAKEDKFFYWHFGVNPVSTLRALLTYIRSGEFGASSTITQQLAKNLLGNENDRTVLNKLQETMYAFAFELYASKETILTMYANTVFMGNGLQGFNEASEAYFGKSLSELNDTETISLLATISGPSSQNPWKQNNKAVSETLAKLLNVEISPETLVVRKRFEEISSANFELQHFSLKPCTQTCQMTIDKKLTDDLREILQRNIARSYQAGGRNGAIVVIKLPENELLSIVGTPNPNGLDSGAHINMALEPRPIGSTVKPFIYYKAFEKGARPYSKVDDREYKYPIATGFSLYPKNYDGKYRGIVTLHEALSNSLNVPAVKTLEYVSLPEFYTFLEQKLGFKTLQNIESYQYGIALGGLEMNLLTLSHLLTMFPENGVLKPLTLFKNNSLAGGQDVIPPMETMSGTRVVGDSKYVELVNRILSDRISGVEQFGLKSSLNLSQNNYAVKTGTSRDYHDSWTVGYTPDFLVGVWLGNTENTGLRQVSGQSGAGTMWHEVMERLINSEYNKKTPFTYTATVPYLIDNKVEYGLPGDNIKQIQNVMLEGNDSLILSPHDGDVFSFQSGMEIELKSSVPARWYSGDTFLGEDIQVPFRPTAPGNYQIRAVTSGKTTSLSIKIVR